MYSIYALPTNNTNNTNDTMEVKKLDIPARFAEIPTGFTTSAQLKKHEQERYSVFYNNFWDEARTIVGATKSDITWVGRHWEAVLNWIREVYTPPKAKASTLRNQIEGLANILLAIDKVKFKEVTRPLFNTGLTTQRIIDKANEESVLDEDDMRNYVSYRRLVAKRNEMYDLWRKDSGDLRANMYHLILALNTYLPPLRLDWLDMNVYPPNSVHSRGVTVEATKTRRGRVSAPPPQTSRVDLATYGEPPINKENYLWEYAPGLWAIVINYDKIENKREEKGLARQIIRLEDDIPGVTDGKRLNQIINESLEAAPRDYVLIGVRTKTAMLESGFRSAMGSMFKPKNPGQNLLRKAYINFWHRAKVNGMELPERVLKGIADRMRHSLEVARGAYRKVNLADEDEDLDVFTTRPQETPATPAIEKKRAVVEPDRIYTTGFRSAVNDEEEEKPYYPPLISRSTVDEPEPAGMQRVNPPPQPLEPKTHYNAAKYQAEYRVTNAEKIRKKKSEHYAKNEIAVLRNKILANLNNGSVRRPMQKSIDRYGLYFDEHSGRWASRETEPEE